MHLRHWLALAILLIPAVALAGPLDARNKVQGNIGGCNYYDTKPHFVDLIKCSDYFYFDQNNNPGSRDSNDWLTAMPTGATNVATLMGQGLGGRLSHLPTGTYHASWEGSGSIQFTGNGLVVTSQNDTDADFTYNPSSSDPNEGRITINQTSFNESNPIKNIRVTIPGGICDNDIFTRVTSAASCTGGASYLKFANHPNIIWNPDFLSNMKGYGVVRFMDGILHTNNNLEEDWTDRVPEGYRSYGPEARQWRTQRGLPWELVFDLCNKLQTICWITVPNLATDDYVQSLAELAVNTLNSSVGLYVEQSNEVWNTRFLAYHQTYPLAQAAGLTLGEYHFQRTREIGNIFKAVMGSNRVWTVYGWRLDSYLCPFHAMCVILDWATTTYGAANLNIDAWAVASYTGVNITSALRTQEPFISEDTDGLFTYLYNVKLAEVYSQIEGIRTTLDIYAPNMHLINYEGGPGSLRYTAGGTYGDEFNNWLDSIYTDSRMKQYTIDAANGQFNRGLELVSQFVDTGMWSIQGRWGAKQFLDNDSSDSPVWAGVLQLQGEAPTVEQGVSTGTSGAGTAGASFY